MAKKTRAALYLRISKDDERTGLAVARQRSECLDVIESLGLDLVKEYTDNGVSAYARNVKRPEFDRMTEDYEAGRFDVVVCWDMDRFSRQPVQLEHWIGLGESRGLKIITPTETTDLGTDNGRMFARMKATIARAEVERKSARQRAQVKQAKENGTFRGRVGFNDPVTIKRIFFSLLGGVGTYRIAATLNAEGKTTLAGKAWSAQAVRRVGMTPRHRGTLVTPEEYDAVQSILSRGVKVGAKQKGLYSGCARCGACGASMTASGPKYTCAWATNHPGQKGHQSIARATLESRIRREVVAALMLPGVKLAGDDSTDEIVSVEVQLGALYDKRADTLSGLNDPDLGLTMDLLKPTLAPLKLEIEALEARKEELLARSATAAMLNGLKAEVFDPDSHRADLDAAAEVATKLGERLDALDGDKRRDLVRGLIHVKVEPGRTPDRVKVRHLTEAGQVLNDPDDDN